MQPSRELGPLGGLLEAASRGMALIGGGVLVGITAVAVGSILSRALFEEPLLGDFELVQFGCAVSISCFLPYTQWRRANLIVDFFTTRASPRVQGLLDRLGSALLGLVMVLLAWRVGVGASELRSYQETSMILGIPTWWAYAVISPSFALTALVSFYIALVPGAVR